MLSRDYSYINNNGDSTVRLSHSIVHGSVEPGSHMQANRKHVPWYSNHPVNDWHREARHDPLVHRSSIFHSNINKLWCNAAIQHMNLPRSSPNCFCCPGSILYFLGSVFLPRVKRLISWSTGLIRHICIACPPIRCKAFSEDFSMWLICVLKVLIRMSLHTPPPYYIQ